MGELLTCPIDGTPLVMAADDGVYESGCHACRREFRFVCGVLKGFDAQPVKQVGHHEAFLHIHAEHETITVSDTVFTASWALVFRDQPMTVTQQRGPNGEWQIVHIATGAKSFRPREAGDRAPVRTAGAIVQGGIITAVATILTVYFYHWAFIALLPLGVLVTAGAAYFRHKSSSTSQQFEPLRLSHLEREQWLLGQLQRYRLESKAVNDRIKQQTKQLTEMQRLASDMQSATGDYAHRLEVVHRGIDALRHHHDNDRKLLDAIARAMEMVTIEYRAARALDYLPDDAIDRLTTTIAELEAIEAESMMLEAQLEANAEVHAIAPN